MQPHKHHLLSPQKSYGIKRRLSLIKDVLLQKKIFLHKLDCFDNISNSTILCVLNRLAYVDWLSIRWIVMIVRMPAEHPGTNPYIKQFSTSEILQEWKKQHKKIIQIDLTGDEEEDKRRFDFIRTEARRLEYTCDTTTILKIHFTDKNTYDQFAELLNILHKDRHKRYTFFRDDFYILGEPLSETNLILLNL